MLARLALVLVAVPLVELTLLVWLGRRIGFLPTVALVLVTGVVGAALARHQGLASLARFRAALDARRLPHCELVDGVLVLAAALLLVSPGVLTDATGFLLLVPPLRRRVGQRVLVAIGRRWKLPVRWSPAEGAVEAEYRVVEEGEEGGRGTPPP
ncbi:MAG TPA: FxsA family protein [Thermoanaerobaculia bacterium]|nr:FxsA family protein [Thermoanaerobaculia bacterium]